ncbi:ATP-grasp domain-containing protein [Spongisporangium articulatum]|uniref:D-alanine--D-alanine ligase n=1 Tax=Spongisporangium articulatum TaxID=3362603 RepID=A0ABW8AJ71_9ACTN
MSVDRSSVRVGVVSGGLSHERDISLQSGRKVQHALRSAGFATSLHDLDGGFVAALRQGQFDVVFPMLHGGVGEDGGLQALLERLDVPFVGSGSAPARRAADKYLAGQALTAAGLTVPDTQLMPVALFKELGAAEVLDLLGFRMTFPLIVKPNSGGSSLGVRVVKHEAELAPALIACFAYCDVALVQRWVDGQEVAVGVIDRGAGPTPYPPVLIHGTHDGVYDFEAHYSTGIISLSTPESVSGLSAGALGDVALRAFNALGLRDLGRVDLVVDGEGVPHVLEVAVTPGLTDTSVFPFGATAAGDPIAEWATALVTRALDR